MEGDEHDVDNKVYFPSSLYFSAIKQDIVTLLCYFMLKKKNQALTTEATIHAHKKNKTVP